MLLVDDNDKLRGLFKLSLETLGGMRVVGEAHDGKTGISEAARLSPDIVLLDLSMPTMDGLEALPKIRRASPLTHVIVLTGFNASRLEDIVLELGASAYLEKGISPAQLPDALRLATAGPAPPLRDLTAERLAYFAKRVRELI